MQSGVKLQRYRTRIHVRAHTNVSANPSIAILTRSLTIMRGLLAGLVLSRCFALETRKTGASALARARELSAPVPKQTSGGEFEGQEWFETHGALLNAAWRELGVHDERFSAFPDEWALDSALLHATARARRDARDEDLVRGLATEIAPGVWHLPLLRPEAVAALRHEMDRAAMSGIPIRRPNGMNRFGMILDGGVDGGCPLLDQFVAGLVARYVQPLGRLLFPANVGLGDDHEYFAFTVQYRAAANGD